MRNWKCEVLVAIHELVEQSLCRVHGISNDAITTFDEQYESKRKYGVLDEPGNDSSAPYYREHQLALKIERLLADELGVDWIEYNKVIAKLDDESQKKRPRI